MIALFVILWSAGWILAVRFLRPAAEGNASAGWRPSIVIPARNEEHNLPRLLESIPQGAEGPLEILVVDDASEDSTAEVARRHGARVVSSRPLPPGWRGKTWACHQGAEAATGEWLMFMDADTWFEPGGLENILTRHHGGALSVLPYHAVRKPVEDLSLFFNICMAAGTVPASLAGQFLLVHRDDYRAAGGHEAVRGRTLENFLLAERMRGAGVELRTIPGRGLISIRMYPEGLNALASGWSKGFAAGAGGTARGTMLLVIAWMSGLMIAPIAAALTGVWWWAAACVLCVLQVSAIGRLLGSFGAPSLFAYPVPLLFFFGLFGRAVLGRGGKSTWKGREIDVD